MSGKQYRPDQMPHSVASDLVYTVCSGLYVPILKVNMVLLKHILELKFNVSHGYVSPKLAAIYHITLNYSDTLNLYYTYPKI